VQHRQQQRYQAQAAQQQQQMEAQQAAAESQMQEAASPAGTDITSQLEQLSTMQAAGLLTPEQFEAAKAKLLGL
jgi:hypothetical protein